MRCVLTPSYTPLAPVEPPLNTTDIVKPIRSQPSTAHITSYVVRGPGEPAPSFTIDDGYSDRHGHPQTVQWSMSSAGFTHPSPSSIESHRDAEGGRYQIPEQTCTYAGHIPHNYYHPAARVDSKSTVPQHSYPPGYHYDQQRVAPSWLTTAMDYIPSVRQHAPRSSHLRMVSQQPHPYPQHYIRSDIDVVSSPASTASRSISSNHHAKSSHTSPPMGDSKSKTPVGNATLHTLPPPPYTYSLTFRQQPIAARACGQGERDRRTIDPPPILELKITDSATGKPTEDSSAFHALGCTLVRMNRNGEEDTTTPTPKVDRASSRPLTGSTVASPYQGKDERGRPGTFFVLADLSCRDPGLHKLRFNLTRLDPTRTTPGMRHPNVAVVESAVFLVYVAKDFPGMRASSALLRTLRAQGLNVPLKKGKDAKEAKLRALDGDGGGGRQTRGSEVDSDEDDLQDRDDDDSGADEEDEGYVDHEPPCEGKHALHSGRKRAKKQHSRNKSTGRKRKRRPSAL